MTNPAPAFNSSAPAAGAPTVRAAGIDCGTNTIRLLIADVDPVHGTLHDVVRTLRIVRLGEGVDATGRLAPAALERTMAALREYRDLMAQHGLEPGAATVRMVATSATRDAENAGDFAGMARDVIGRDPEVVPGTEEAALSFTGALATARRAGRPPYLVVDLGGGSTELVLGKDRPEAAFSMDIGSVRLTERLLRSDPPTAEELRAARAEVDRWLDRAAERVDLARARTVVGVAGTSTTVTAYALGLTEYDPLRIDGTAMSVADTAQACRRLWEMTVAQRLALGYIEPHRADVIGAGALIWALVLRRVEAAVQGVGGALGPVVTSEHDILDGVTLSAAGLA